MLSMINVRVAMIGSFHGTFTSMMFGYLKYTRNTVSWMQPVSKTFENSILVLKLSLNRKMLLFPVQFRIYINNINQNIP